MQVLLALLDLDVREAPNHVLSGNDAEFDRLKNLQRVLVQDLKRASDPFVGGFESIAVRK
jgi:hypothetical protein